MSDHSMTRRTLLGLAAALPLASNERLVQTVTGPVPARQLGLTLMHEHVVTDLRAPAERGEGDYDRGDAVAAAKPHLEALVEAGGKTLVEPTPIFIGRDLEALWRLSRATGLLIVGATGVYGAAGRIFIPDYAREESAAKLAERYVQEFEEGVGPRNVKPGVIKTGVNRATPLPAVERKLVQAAALAHLATGMTVLSHTGPAAPVFEQLEILEETGMDPRRFVWVHAQNERDHASHLRIARGGAWVEFDGIGPDSAEWHVACLRAMAGAGLLERTLISQDAGWYRPGPERGSKFRGYVYLLEEFVPLLLRNGFSQAEIDLLLVENPAKALTGG